MSFHELQAAIDNGNAADILTVIDSTSGSPSPIGQMIIIQADGTVSGQLETLVMENILHIVQTTVWTKPVTISVEDGLGNTYRLFWDRMVKKFSAIVFGGGHISQPLVQILSLMGFEVTVIDDRPEFANTARFPGAYRVICQKFQLVVKELTVDNETAVIIVTRGHRYDMDCLRAVMGSNARYLGMIGSRKRIREIIKLIKEEGAPADLETRLRAPIGLDLKAETPAEIALSIAAEVVSVFRNGSGRPLSEYKEAF
ncbi:MULTISPECIES: XdhC family protein [Sporomusa]|uniref:XdhC family protein n=1 Tax=Sporomusa TaxID=2375 RepID=UPI003158C4AB